MFKYNYTREIPSIDFKTGNSFRIAVKEFAEKYLFLSSAKSVHNFVKFVFILFTNLIDCKGSDSAKNL